MDNKYEASYNEDEIGISLDYEEQNNKEENFHVQEESNVYEYLIKMKEDNDTLKLEIEKCKFESERKEELIRELSNSNDLYKKEVMRLIEINEENVKRAVFWDSAFKEIKNKIGYIDEQEISYRAELDNLKCKNEDLIFENEYLKEKISSDNNEYKLKFNFI